MEWGPATKLRAKQAPERYAVREFGPRTRTQTQPMARMFGFIGNRADLGARVLEANRSLLRARRTDGEPLGWGLGFYQSGEVLLRRRPIDDRAEIDLVEAAEDIRTDVMLGHVRRASVGALTVRRNSLTPLPICEFSWPTVELVSLK